MTDITKHSSITQVLHDFGQEMNDSLKAELLKDSAYVSGDLAEQIDFTSTINGEGFLFQLKLKDYYDYVNQGVNGTKSNPIGNRGTPYKYLSSSKIPFYFAKKWMNDKGIFKSPGATITSIAGKQYKAGSRDSQAFAMAKSFKEHGTKGNHFYDNVVTTERLEQLRKDLALAASGDMKTVLTDSFKLGT